MRQSKRCYVKSVNGAEQRIDVQIMSFAGEGIFKIDTEADDVYQILVQNALATVIERGSCIQITWMYPESIVLSCSIVITSPRRLP